MNRWVDMYNRTMGAWKWTNLLRESRTDWCLAPVVRNVTTETPNIWTNTANASFMYSPSKRCKTWELTFTDAKKGLEQAGRACHSLPQSTWIRSQWAGEFTICVIRMIPPVLIAHHPNATVTPYHNSCIILRRQTMKSAKRLQPSPCVATNICPPLKGWKKRHSDGLGLSCTWQR